MCIRDSITSDRDDYDYIYEQANLAELPGRRFQKKRNHVSRFIRENPDWQFHPLTKEDLPAIRAFNDAWSQLYENKDNPGIQTEHTSIELLFDNFDKLDLRGGYVTAGGRIVASVSYTHLGNDEPGQTVAHRRRGGHAAGAALCLSLIHI